ncbi:unnamed protein product [Dovyalis caffra]|uniref:Uncharacterized protein n=1 Tax=Dovyalis caffra TaxID=77055 RepID=A0AAV1SX23_9ROSI|nr:unnamed protein product [Dovyalis caffra]
MFACPNLVGSFPAAPKLTKFNLNNRLRTHLSYSSGKWFLEVLEDSLLKGNKRASGVFSSITEIEIHGCNSLKSCQLDILPHFSKFTITYCLGLESLCILEGPLLYLHQLVVRRCPNLKSLPENMYSLLPSLEELELSSLPKVYSFPIGRLPSKLNSLCIRDCIKLNVLSPLLQSLLSLSHFSFGGDGDVKSFSNETLLLPSTLTSLEIHNLRNLKSLDYKVLQHLTSLQNLKICRCPKLEFIQEELLPSSIEHLEILNLKDPDYKGLQHLTSLRELKIWSSSKLEPIPEDVDYKGLQHLGSLRQLKICGCPKLESVPEEGLPPSLEYLEIGNLENLKSLNYKGLQHLNSIHHLKIWRCHKLKSMPEQGLPSSLKFLQILDCPSLPKRCKRETGEDWPMISHIPRITI